MFSEQENCIHSHLFHKYPYAAFIIEDNVIVNCNQAAMSLFGFYEKKQLIGLHLYDLCPLVQKDGQLSKNKLEKQLSQSHERNEERFIWTHKKSNGEKFNAEIILISEIFADREIKIATVRDIKDKTILINDLDTQNINFEQLFNSFPSAVAIINNNLEILNINKCFKELFQYSHEEIIKNNIKELLSLDLFDTKLWDIKERIYNQDTICDVKTVCRRKSGNFVDISFSMYPIIHDNVHIGNYAVCTDITELRKREEKIRFLSHRDTLTRLYNKDYFINHVRDQITNLENIHSSNVKMGVLLLDINDFNSINDNLGYNIGDIFLKIIAERLKEHIGNKGIVSKFGGDEFIILVYNIENRRQLVRLGRDILKIFDKPFTINRYDFFVTCSIGISMYPHHGDNSHDLIKSADIAVQKAKKYNGNKVVIYNYKLNQDVTEKFLIDSYLRYAIENNELYLNYQPILDAQSERITGLEALVRWHSSEIGYVPPNKFIPISEGNGMVLPIGEWVIKNACMQLKKWNDMGYKEIFLSINVSIKQLEQKNFADFVIRTTSKLRLNPTNIVLEITESVYMENLERIYRNLKKLNKFGIQISIDDFGTGYSSLGQLSKLEISKLKIDKSFIKELHINSNNAKIVTAIIVMAKSLNLSIVAEGVEESEHTVFLKKAGCDMLQGFLYSRPVSAEKIKQLLKKGTLSQSAEKE